MPANSLRVPLGNTYVLAQSAAVLDFLIQRIGHTDVKVVAIQSGGPAPQADSVNYFMLDNANSALLRVGLENADIYVRSASDTDPAFITKCPS